MAARAHRPTKLGVQGFYSVRRVDDAADAFGEGEEGDDVLPIASPALRDGRIFLASPAAVAASALEGKITDPAVYLKTGDCGNGR